MLSKIKPNKNIRCEFCDSLAYYFGCVEYNPIYVCSSCSHTFHAPFLPNQLRNQLKNSVIHVEPLFGMDFQKAVYIKKAWYDGQSFRVLNGKKAIKKISKFNAPMPCILIFHYYDGLRTCKLRIGATNGTNINFSNN